MIRTTTFKTNTLDIVFFFFFVLACSTMSDSEYIYTTEDTHICTLQEKLDELTKKVYKHLHELGLSQPIGLKVIWYFDSGPKMIAYNTFDNISIEQAYTQGRSRSDKIYVNENGYYYVDFGEPFTQRFEVRNSQGTYETVPDRKTSVRRVVYTNFVDSSTATTLTVPQAQSMSEKFDDSDKEEDVEMLPP